MLSRKEVAYHAEMLIIQVSQCEYVDLEGVIRNVGGQFRDLVFPTNVANSEARLSFREVHRQVKIDVIVPYRVIGARRRCDFVQSVDCVVDPHRMVSVRE